MNSCKPIAITSLSPDNLGRVFSFAERHERSDVLPLVCKSFRDQLKASGELYWTLNMRLDLTRYAADGSHDDSGKLQLLAMQQWADTRLPFAQQLQLYLSEAGCKLFERPLADIIQQLSRSNRVEGLKLVMQGSLWLPERLTLLSSLKHLHISARETYSALPEDIGLLTQLETLNLDFAFSGGNQAKVDFMPVGLLNLNKLRVLRVRGGGTRYVPAHVWRIPSLQELIFWNAGSLEFPEAPHVQAGNAMPALSITLLEFIECSLQSVPQQVSMLANLKELDLRCNRLTRFPANIGTGAPLLETLSLSFNNLEYMPFSVRPKLLNLQSLNLSFNHRLKVALCDLCTSDFWREQNRDLYEFGFPRSCSDNINSLVRALPRLEVLNLKQAPKHWWSDACTKQINKLHRNNRKWRPSLEVIM